MSKSEKGFPFWFSELMRGEKQLAVGVGRGRPVSFVRWGRARGREGLPLSPRLLHRVARCASRTFGRRRDGFSSL